MGSHGHRLDFDAAHNWAFILNTIQVMGSVGTVFHVCCLLETTTFRFHIRTLPMRPPLSVKQRLFIDRDG